MWYVILATYNDRKASGAIKILHFPAPIPRVRWTPAALIYLCEQAPDVAKQPTPMPSALKTEPLIIPLPSKELKLLKKRQEKYNGLPRSERRRTKRMRQKEQQNLQTVKPPDEAKAAIKAKQRKKPIKPRRQGKL